MLLGIFQRARRRASVLMIVFAMMFVLITLVAGLHYRQSSSRASMFHEEAKLQARVAAEYELARQCCPDAVFSPDRQVVTGTNQHSKDLDVPPLQANKLFSDDSLIEIGTGKTVTGEKLTGRAGKSWNLLKASSSDPAVQPDKSKFLAVVSSDFPYAACAPNGSIQGQEAMAWRNQLFGRAGVPTRTAHSGGTTRMAAGGDITLTQCAYGEFYTVKGAVSVDQGLHVTYQGPPADLVGPNAYTATLKQQILAATTKLSSQAQDKSSLMGGTLFDVDTILSFFKGSKEAEDSMAKSLSLRSAMKFPFLMIPGLRVKGIIVMIWLHMPYAPDFPPDSGKQTAVSEEKQKELTDKTDEIEAKQKETDALKAQAAAETDADKKKALEANVATSEKENAALADGLKDLGTQIADETGTKDDGSPFKLDPGPTNRDGDKDLSDKGATGWSYKPFYKKIFDFCSDCAISLFTGKTPDVEAWAKSLYQEVRLVHFGGKSFDTDFDISATDAKITATFNVPPGRGVKIKTNLTLNGDLWLMRGSSLVIDGNLVLTNPNQGKFDPRLPRGRIFMEEGANLVVSGNLVCAGSELLGSVLVGTPINKMHAGMGSILVGGDIDIPYGVWPAFSVADLDLSGVPELNTFRSIVSTVIPNLAKLAGPFHRRQPYFSSYATTFLCTCMIIPPVPVPIPVPIPLPLPTPANINIKVFRALTMIYTIQMNLAWGENFMTHCDWWFLGQGTVPMFPKIDPTVYIDKLKNLKIPALPDMDKITTMVKDKAPDLAKQMIPPLLTQLIVKLVVDQLSMGFGGAVVDAFPIEDWVRKVVEVEDVQTALLEIPGLTDLANSIKDKVGDAAALMLAHETPGILISAGGSLKVASDQTLSVPVPMTVGTYVAGGDLVSNASVTIGSVISLNGNIQVKNLLFDPNSTRCSIYVPLNTPTKVTTIDWMDWAIEYRYGKLFENTTDAAIDIGPQLRYPTAEGWIQ